MKRCTILSTMDPIRHVIIEGLPAAGKSEILELLARVYPQTVRVLPELVKDLVMRLHLDLFRDRAKLTEAITAELPRRADAIRSVLEGGFLCIEESHLAVHCAYAHALGDRAFIEAFNALEGRLPKPDCYVRLEIPITESRTRQIARATPGFEVSEDDLHSMLGHLDRWHERRQTNLLRVNADRPAHETLDEIERQLGLTYGVRANALRETFDVLLLLGRPAGGKSEFIDFFTSCPPSVAASEYRIAPISVVDDFPILWELFRDDDLWEQLGRPRLYSRRCDGNYAVTDPGLWPFLIGRINRTISDLRALDHAAGRTLIVEFSRGGPTGYRDALAALSPEILRRAAILYISVSFEESWRRNIARYDRDNRGGILTHSVPREEMEKTYGVDDWSDLAHAPVGVIDVAGIRVPYATMPNEPESNDPAVLGPRYQGALVSLYEQWRGRS